MSKLYATAGTKIGIGLAFAATGTDLTVSDFTTGTPTPTYVEIGGTTNIGGAGDTSEAIKSTHIAVARVRKLKGPRDAGQMQIVCDLDPTDAGQIAVIAAEKTPYSYMFKVELTDKPAAGASPKNSMRYFVAYVMSAAEQYDEANNVMKLNITLEIDSNVVRVAASAT